MAVIKGTLKSEKLTGSVKDDTITGLAGLDTLNGGLGNDLLDGGADNDVLNGGNGDDTLNGGSGNDKLNGEAGNDTLNGGLGVDTMMGGNGNDYYVVDNLNDVVTELSTSLKLGGNDTIETTLSVYTLPTNVENLIFTTPKNVKGIGNKTDNKIVGNNGNDTLSGMMGNDSLIGGNGDDTALFNNNKDQYQITANGTTQITVKFIGVAKNGVINDGEDTLTGIEFLKFSDGIISAKDIFNPKVESPVVIATPIPEIVVVPAVVSTSSVPDSPIPISTQNFEAKAPFIYQTNNVNQLDSITTLLTYSPSVTNGVDYSTFEPEQWRIRASDAALAFDLTQTDKTTNSVIFQGKLEASDNAQTWYKINLTQTSTLNMQDLSQNTDVIDAALFASNGTDGLTYYGSLFDTSGQLKRYQNLPAGDYTLRIDKGDAVLNDARLNQAADFKVSLNTEPSADFILPALQFDATSSTIHAELLPQQSDAYYKFTLSKSTTFTLDTTSFASEFDIGLYKPASNRGVSGIHYTYFLNAPEAHIYQLSEGTYYLNVGAISPFSILKTLDIPVIANSISFNTTFDTIAPQTLKADIENPQVPFQRDADGNLVLTYSFDLNKIPDPKDASPNPTKFSDAQQQAARLAFQDYANIAKLKFVEVPNGSSEKADITFVNVSTLGSAAADTTTPTSWMNDFENALVRVNLSDKSNADVSVGSSGYSTFLHEIGHALGLKHPRSYGGDGQGSVFPFLADAKDNAQYTVMSYNSHPYKNADGYDFYSNSAAISAKTPLLYDIAAVQSLYGENTNYKTGDDIYRWDTNTDPYMTIWDSGGVDTIDASNQTQSQTIDLRAGQFSSIGAIGLMYTDNSTELYPPKDNLSIAYNTIIEKAIGGSANDTLIGNSVANQLTGNAGSDNFVFASQLSAFNVDTITDFNPLEDKITFDRSIFNTLNPGSQLNANALLVGNNVVSAENTIEHLIFDSLNHSLYYDSDGIGGVQSIKIAILSNVSQLNAGEIFIQG
ncbi:MAG: M10 family metallopeptidase C-terminal domain-containing protein [Methylococcales bacterium]|nr:M10 family metallopeptidase C-terminal domain-containing protein [Methylococcales bacterium]